MSNSNTGGGFPLFAILGIVFIILKLCGVIAWSWLWVLAPFWGPLALALVLAVIAAPFVFVAKRAAEKKLAEQRSSFYHFN
jgi:energy-coupling factor transporter transmembrane protein EcfT